MSTIKSAIKSVSSINSTAALSSKDSLRKIASNKEIEVTRTNGYKADPKLLWIEEGFNIREIDEDHVKGFMDSYKNGKFVPPVEVEVVDVDGEHRLKVIEGHHRTIAVFALLEEGMDIQTIPVIELQGNEIDQLTRMIKSTEGKPLTPVELAHAYKRMESFGLNKSQIGETVGASGAHINNIMMLLSAPQELKTMVHNGEYAHSLAIANIRTHGPDLALAMAIEDNKVKEAKESAKKEGKPLKKTERTSAFRKMSLPSKKVQTLSSVVTSIADNIKVEELVDSEEVQLKIDSKTAMLLLELVDQIKEIDDHNVNIEQKMKEAVELAMTNKSQK